MLALGAREGRLSEWLITNNVCGYKELCYALDIFKGDTGEGEIPSRPQLPPLNFDDIPECLYKYDILGAEKKAEVMQGSISAFKQIYPSIYDKVLLDIIKTVGSKQSYGINDAIKYITKKYPSRVITEYEGAHAFIDGNYKTDLIGGNIDEPFIDFENRVCIFEFPPKSNWDGYLGSDNAAMLIPIARDGKLVDFWFGLNTLGYEELKTALYIFCGCGKDVNETYKKFRHCHG